MKRPLNAADAHAMKQPRLGGFTPNVQQSQFQHQQLQRVQQQQHMQQQHMQKHPHVHGTQSEHLGQRPHHLQQPHGTQSHAGVARPVPSNVSPKDIFIVSTTGNDGNEVVIKTLMGEYAEKGMNHGRKVYQKRSEGSESVEVLMYYWDNRDGPAFEGWWFGNKLGGTQVWSHCKDSGLLPPKAGWTIPWDGPVRQSLVVVNKELQLKAEAEEKLLKLSAEVAKVETESVEALASAKEAVGDGTCPEAFVEAEKSLEPFVKAAGFVANNIATTQKTVVGDVQGFEKLAAQLEKTQKSLASEISNMQTTKQKVEQAAKDKEAEERDGALLDTMLPDATEKTNAAEDMVEKAVITAEMVECGGDDDAAVRQAIEETEASTKRAQAAIGDARIFLNAKLAGTKRFSEKIKELANVELGKLQHQLQEAHNRLLPIKTIRRDYEAKRLAARLVAEVEEKMALAEVAVDRAEEMVFLAGSGPATKEGLTEAQQALKGGEEQVNQAARFLDGKKQSSTGPALEQFTQFEPRVDTARTRITKLRTSLKEANERVTSEAYIAEASDKVQAVTEAMTKLEEFEASFQGESAPSLEEALATVKEMTSVASGAQTAASMARMFIQMKLLEVKRFGGSGADATQKLQECQSQIQAATQRITELKGNASKRTRVALVKEAEKEVARAEELANKVVLAARVFADDAKLTSISSEEAQEANKKTIAAEKEATEVLNQARKLISQRQIEAKGRDSSVEVSSELIKFQTRIAAAQQEVAKQKQLLASVEQRVAAKHMLEEGEKRLQGTEEKISKASAAVVALGEVTPDTVVDGGSGSPQAAKAAEMLVSEAQIALKTTVGHLKSLMRPTEFAREFLGKLEPRWKEGQDKLESLSLALRGRNEKLTTMSLVQEAQQKVSECGVHLEKAVALEAAFHVDGTIVVPENGKSLIEDLEKAISVAQQNASSTKTFTTMKRLVVKRLSESAAKTTTEALNKIQATVDETLKRVAELKGKCIEIKRASARLAVK